MTEREKKDLGLWYMGRRDNSLRDVKLGAEVKCFEINRTSPEKREERHRLFKELFSRFGDNSIILSPFECDYGYNIKIGDKTFINHNVYLMDCAPIEIGDHVLIGPSTGVYTATHAVDYKDRNNGFEKADPITIGDNIWIGGDVTVLGGVTIGSGSIIGAKSLVTRDIPPNVIAAGNPCKVVREITEEDKLSEAITAAYIDFI